MAAPNAKTIRLGPGRHAAGGAEVCIVELASMLADDPFSDRPRSVCPYLAAFLRAYNDNLADARRQDLIPLAAAIVGSRGDSAAGAERAEMLIDWCYRVWAQRAIRWPCGPIRVEGRMLDRLEDAGRFVAGRARRDRSIHQRTLSVIAAAATAPSDGHAATEFVLDAAHIAALAA